MEIFKIKTWPPSREEEFAKQIWKWEWIKKRFEEKFYSNRKGENEEFFNIHESPDLVARIK
jgi:hypothetical protein